MANRPNRPGSSPAPAPAGGGQNRPRNRPNNHPGNRNPHNNRPRNKPGIPETYPGTPSVFDPTANYGRDKASAYLNTSLGHRDINNDHQGFYNYLWGRGGVGVNEGAQPFHAWLRTSGYQRLEDGYNAARLTNPKLTYAKYMQTTGVPGDANAFSTTTPAGYAAPDLKKGKGKNGFNPYVNKAENSAPNLQQWMQMQRDAYRSLTPEQSGEYMAGYTLGPGRWSVYG